MEQTTSPRSRHCKHSVSATCYSSPRLLDAAVRPCNITSPTPSPIYPPVFRAGRISCPPSTLYCRRRISKHSPALAVMVEPSQWQATRVLDHVCDLRVSITTRDYVDTDRWGRGSQPGPRFSSRSAAKRALSTLTTIASRPRLPPPPTTNPPLPVPPSPGSDKYQLPPAPPPHVVLNESSSVGPMSRTRESSFAERFSEPPSFGNLRDSSSASSRPRTPLGGRRPRGGGNTTTVANHTHASAALADYLELNDEVVVERVFDDNDEPLSATGAGSVASVPQSPHTRGLFAQKSSRSPSKIFSALARLSDAEPPRRGAADDGLVPLVSDIPDRPRPHDPWADLVDDDEVYFEDAGDVATADAPHSGSERVRPQLREQMFSAIKSYHHKNFGFDDDDDDDFADDSASDSTVNSAHTDRSGALQQYLRKPAPVMHADEAFEESDISHSFEDAAVPLAGSRAYASRTQPHRKSAMALS